MASTRISMSVPARSRTLQCFVAPPAEQPASGRRYTTLMYWRLLRHNRDFRLLYAGTLISLGGDWFLTVALLDLVLQLTHSATLASLMLLCQSLPIFLFTPLAGHVIDRVDRRKLMIIVDVVRTGACLLPLIARTPAL